MPTVRLLFFGVLKDLVGSSERAIEVASGTTAGQILESLCRSHETLSNRRSSILIARNREFTTPDTIVAEGDEVAFLPPVSGGAAHSRNVFRITRDPISAQELTASLLSREDGAVVAFEGVVRNNTRGRRTMYLEYECYEPMALAGIERIGNELREKHGISALGILHRLGQLQIGEASVVIVAVSPHRKQAFAAAHEAIDRLKREVPIWKKEFFEDGAVWVDGEWDEALIRSSI